MIFAEPIFRNTLGCMAASARSLRQQGLCKINRPRHGQAEKGYLPVKICKAAFGLALAGSLAVATAAHATIVYSNENGFGVTSDPTTATTFTLTQPDLISFIDVYNDGLTYPDSATATVTVNIYDSSSQLESTSTASYYSFFANFTVGDPNLSNTAADNGFAHYQSAPYVELAAGTYTITEDPTSTLTWSYDGQSGNEGFAAVGDAPEPASIALLGSSLLGLAVSRRRKRK